MTWLAPIAGGYLLGSIPFAWIIVRLLKGVDVRQHGSGNVGATNVVRVAGLPAGLAAGTLDVLKGFAAVALLRALDPGAEAGRLVAVGCAAIAGHLWPVWLRFRGGKGVLTTAGVFLALAWLPLLLAVAAWLLLFGTTRYVSAGSLAAAATLSSTTCLLPGSWSATPIRVSAVCACALVVVMHRGNIARLAAGTERRMGKRS